MDTFNALPPTERAAWAVAAMTAVGLTVSIAPIGIALIIGMVVVWRKRYPSTTPKDVETPMSEPVFDYPEDYTAPPPPAPAPETVTTAPEPTAPTTAPAPETDGGWGF